jgi:hypothetical protein
MYNQAIVLTTGHICAGKSTVYKQLQKHIDIKNVDIAQIHKRKGNMFRTDKKFFNQEPRLYHLCADVITQLFNKSSVYVEVLGEEPWFSKFRSTLDKLWVPMIEVELQRNSVDCALKCLHDRCFSSGAHDEEDEALAYYEAESIYLQEHYGFTFNPRAKKFITTHKNCNNVTEHILQELRRK